jgi:predicted DNA-binding transcriptional regulator YafY
MLTEKEVEAVLDACTTSSSSSSSNSGLKHVICMSLTGSQQQGQFPFGGQSSGSKVAAARSVEQAILRRRYCY